MELWMDIFGDGDLRMDIEGKSQLIPIEFFGQTH